MMPSDALHITQSSVLPPAQPAYILRGHTAQIHAVNFLRQNLCLLSGDAEGWVVLWNVPIKRPIAVWRAHNNAILGLDSWDDENIITHGRDNKLNVWQIREIDEPSFSTILPIDDLVSDRKKPWLLHSLAVNALNFCSFAKCKRKASTSLYPSPASATASNEASREIFIAVPGMQDGHINVMLLPSEERVATIPSPKDIQTGMVMAIGLHYDQGDNLIVLAGYESGHACVWRRNPSNQWQSVYTRRSHAQPILSLDAAPAFQCFFTSSADAIVARHPLSDDAAARTQEVRTKHAGQQSLRVRSDEKVFATAGWDGRARVYSAKSVNELAVLKWHKEGCYALAFASITAPSDTGEAQTAIPGGLTPRSLTVSEQRTAKAKSTHWLAAGSKDGKISLWDIY